eukprot:COSAG01_NODE_9201_length_2522_cov_8.782088_3_plen_379_part_01
MDESSPELKAGGAPANRPLSRFSSVPTVVQLRTARLSPGVSPVSSPGSSPERQRWPSAIEHDGCSWVATAARLDLAACAQPCLRQLLKGCRAEQYLGAFCAHGFRTKKDVNFLEEPHLVEMGVNMATRCRLLRQIDVADPHTVELQLRYDGCFLPNLVRLFGRQEFASVVDTYGQHQLHPATEARLVQRIQNLAANELRQQAKTAAVVSSVADQIYTPERMRVLVRDASEQLLSRLVHLESQSQSETIAEPRTEEQPGDVRVDDGSAVWHTQLRGGPKPKGSIGKKLLPANTSRPLPARPNPSRPLPTRPTSTLPYRSQPLPPLPSSLLAGRYSTKITIIQGSICIIFEGLALWAAEAVGSLALGGDPHSKFHQRIVAI